MSPVRWVLGSRLFSVLLVLGHAAGYPAGYTLKGQFYIMYIQPQLKKKKEANLTLPCVHFSLLQAWEVNKGTNCVTTYLADCETQLSQAPRRGLLYGVPVSLKECFSYKVCPASHPAPPPAPLSLPASLPPGLPWALRGSIRVQRP